MSRYIAGVKATIGCLGMVAIIASRGEALGAVTTVGQGNVGFEAIGPAGMKINGVSNGIGTAESEGKIKITASTTDFRTGIGLRDRHLKEYLESEKHPTAELVVDRAQVTLPQNTAPTSGSVTAPLTLHGVTKQVHVAYRIVPGAGQFKVHGSIEVNIQDFNIKKPCYLGVCVDDKVEVTADFSINATAQPN